MHLYFRVDDVEAAAARVRDLGGEVLSVGDYESGGNAECVDDQGLRAITLDVTGADSTEVANVAEELATQMRRIPLVADVGEEARVRSMFSAYWPQVVLHAAAHKHVPMMESNPA